MTFDQFADGLIGIFAYDSGSVDSGIHDERLHQDLVDFLQEEDKEHWLEARHCTTPKHWAESVGGVWVARCADREGRVVE